MGGSGGGDPHYVRKQFHNNFLSRVEMIDVTLLWPEQNTDLSRITDECAECGLNSNYFNPPHTHTLYSPSFPPSLWLFRSFQLSIQFFSSFFAQHS